MVIDEINSRNQFNVDTYWFKLQEKDNWIAVEPMFEQLTTFSDIFKDFLVHPEKNYVIRQSDLQYFYDLKKVMDL